MPELSLTPKELAELRCAHREARKKRDADRIKAVVLVATGWSIAQVAQALLLDEDTVRNYLARYRRGGLPTLLKERYQGGHTRLSSQQQAEFEEHLQGHVYGSVKEIVAYVRQHYHVSYSERGMTDLLHRLGYRYKKTKVVPGKADPQAQQAFVEHYEKLKNIKGPQDPIYFMDGTHPLHNPMPAYGWIKQGTEQTLPSNTGRRRVNINGALDLVTMEAAVRFDATINAQSTVALLESLEQKHPKADCVYVICDNAPYYRCRVVQSFLEHSKVRLVFLPPYSPNLNLIERLWKYFKKQVLYSTYYPTFDAFKAACEAFFKNLRRHREPLTSLLRENFQIIGA